MYLYNTKADKAAELIGMSARSLRRWRIEGKIPGFAFVDNGHRNVRYCADLLNAWWINRNDPKALDRIATEAHKTNSKIRKAG